MRVYLLFFICSTLAQGEAEEDDQKISTCSYVPLIDVDICHGVSPFNLLIFLILRLLWLSQEVILPILMTGGSLKSVLLSLSFVLLSLLHSVSSLATNTPGLAPMTGLWSLPS